MGKFKILVVDDEPDVRMYFRSLLMDNDFDVEEAVDGEDGIKRVKEIMPDLVILDIIMPKESGVKFCMKMSENKEFINIPIIIVSAMGQYKSLYDINRPKLPKPKAFFEKPINEEKFLATVKSILG
ncbi:MAG: response regulator [bacterium]|nr:response regulator [bacterium]